MKRPLLPLLLAGLAAQAWAGTEIKAHLEGTSDAKAWVNAEVFIADGHLRLDFKGPLSHGSLIYDRETATVTVVDRIHKDVFSLTPSDQAAAKLLLAINAGQLKSQSSSADANSRRAYAIAAKNAQAIFNGVPRLKAQGEQVGGFSCDDYVTDRPGQDPAGDAGKLREVWVTTPEAAGMNGEDYNTFRGLVHLVLDLSSDELQALGADISGFQQDLSDSNLPLQAVLYAKGRPSARFKILGIKSFEPDAGAFDPPADYAVLGLMDLVRQGAAGR